MRRRRCGFSRETCPIRDRVVASPMLAAAGCKPFDWMVSVGGCSPLDGVSTDSALRPKCVVLGDRFRPGFFHDHTPPPLSVVVRLRAGRCHVAHRFMGCPTTPHWHQGRCKQQERRGYTRRYRRPDRQAQCGQRNTSAGAGRCQCGRGPRANSARPCMVLTRRDRWPFRRQHAPCGGRVSKGARDQEHRQGRCADMGCIECAECRFRSTVCPLHGDGQRRRRPLHPHAKRHGRARQTQIAGLRKH